LVVMGHCHNASLHKFEAGLYVNTGDWYEARTFVTLTDRVQLCRWTSEGSELIREEIFLQD